MYLTFCVVLKILLTYDYYDYGSTRVNIIFQSLYSAFVLATTLWCTLLIIYRILTIAGVKHGAGGRLRLYHHCIEVQVESSALYSISLIVDLALYISNSFGEYYLTVIAGIARVCL